MCIKIYGPPAPQSFAPASPPPPHASISSSPPSGREAGLGGPDGPARCAQLVGTGCARAVERSGGAAPAEGGCCLARGEAGFAPNPLLLLPTRKQYLGVPEPCRHGRRVSRTLQLKACPTTQRPSKAAVRSRCRRSEFLLEWVIRSGPRAGDGRWLRMEATLGAHMRYEMRSIFDSCDNSAFSKEYHKCPHGKRAR